ncbi:MAG: TonB-dependent receptor [Gemmatimonadaceae bacterium]|nr:TonB-dependent receptor [Gemmatimonadaceae bacterium]
MIHRLVIDRCRRAIKGLVLPVLAGILASSSVSAQTSTGSIRGFVRGTGDAPLADAQVAARDIETNQTRGAITNASGAYNIGALRPATYEVTVRRIGLSPQTRSIRVLIGQTLDVSFQLAEAAVELAAVQVVASAQAETRTSEVATNITQAQIENLPTSGRNILDLASLAPGVRVSEDRIDATSKSFAAGAQNAEQVNLFVDGTTYKNDIIAGGVAGQDASRGNPFPRNAIQEFRIATNNFKAEYQKASSAIITAVTKSGTNQWEGSSFLTFQNARFVALDSFALQRKGADENFETPKYSRYLFGLNGGGPIVQDKMFFFGSYEGNFQNREGETRFFGDPAKFPTPIRATQGEVNDAPFRSHLLFGKLTWSRSESQTVEFSSDVRIENEKRDFGGQFNCQCRAFSAGNDFKNRVATARAKHSFFGTLGTNEALLSYQYYQFATEPFDFGTPSQEFEGFGRIGGADSRQDLTQNRLSLRNDFTVRPVELAGSHIFKVGGNIDYVRYNLDKQLDENPLFFFNSGNNFASPNRAIIGTGDPVVDGNNGQFGIYAQDDWTPVERLTLNLGIRWDYESGAFNRDFVTPQNIRDSVTAFRDSLFVDVDPDRFFTDGDDRQGFYGAIQPRVGFSYGVDRNSRTTVFGAWGIFYDRMPFNNTIDESYRQQHPRYLIRFSDTGDPGTIPFQSSYFSREGLLALINSGIPLRQEIFLVPNDLEPPHSNQWSLGARHDFGAFNASVTYNQTRSYKGYSYDFADLTFRPGFGRACCLERRIPAYERVLVGNNSIRTWYDAFLIQLDKPYRLSRSNWGWGAGLAVTIAEAEAEGGDLFSFPQVNLNPRHPIGDDERYRAVASFITDVPYAFGFQFSGLITLGSGRPFNRVTGNANLGDVVLFGSERPEKRDFIIPNAFAYRKVDLRIRKDFPNFAGNQLGVTLDLFNAFNFNNFGCFQDFFSFTNDRGVVDENENFGRSGCTISDPRRLQVGLTYDFGPRVVGRGGR